MNTKKLLGKFRHLLKSKDQRELAETRDSLKQLLKKLRKRRKTLEEKLAHSQNSSDYKRIHDELKVLKAQRAKGLTALKEMQEQNNKPQS